MLRFVEVERLTAHRGLPVRGALVPLYRGHELLARVTQSAEMELPARRGSTKTGSKRDQDVKVFLV
jgi:hypothetical protein